MSNMRADVRLVTVSDARNFRRLQRYLDNTALTIIYVHITHVCQNIIEEYLMQDHVKLVVYSDMFYQKLVAMVIGANAMVLPPDVTDVFRLESTSANIGLCVCNEYTQGDIPHYEMW